MLRPKSPRGTSAWLELCSWMPSSVCMSWCHICSWRDGHSCPSRGSIWGHMDTTWCRCGVGRCMGAAGSLPLSGHGSAGICLGRSLLWLRWGCCSLCLKLHPDKKNTLGKIHAWMKFLIHLLRLTAQLYTHVEAKSYYHLLFKLIRSLAIRKTFFFIYKWQWNEMKWIFCPIKRKSKKGCLFFLSFPVEISQALFIQAV